MRLRLEQLGKLDPVDAPGEDPTPVEETTVTNINVLRVFSFVALIIYGGGVAFSHVVYSSDDREACHRAGGFMGRIWCPDSVDTKGFTVHFVRALGWPVEILRAPSDGSEDSGTAFATSKLKGETASKLRPLAQQGDATAQFKLGLLYEDGRGVAINYEEAAKWFRLAAEQGETQAQNSISFAYAKGKGVDQNYVEAYKWASLAASRGAEKTLVERDNLIAKMSKTQIAEAERLARSWQPKSAELASLQLRKETERAAVIETQRLLGSLGYKVGDADGVAGPRTRAAISDFQLRNGMPTSGEVSRELIARLRNRVREGKLDAVENQ